MRVLIACEESQIVCKAFRSRGHEAYSCDIQECSGGHPEWHIQADALQLLKMRWVYSTGRTTRTKLLDVIGTRNAKERSKTFPGIAKAMAEQWSC